MELSSFYRMYCGVQKYAWGMNQKDPRCFVYRLHSSGHVNQQLQQNAENIHFAELWMGNHISLPSLTKENKQIPKQLPFLFKVLSIDQPLSIQLHPNKQQAEYLHLQFPNHYPDNNHKPELAIALDCFEGMIGFAPKQLIINNFERNQSIIRLLGEIIWNQFINSDASNEQILLKQITTKILALNEQEISEVLTNYQYPIECCASLKEIKLYNDVGFIFVLMMNHVTLQIGECLLMKAGLIHAYLKGNCIEAMANSDNVVRCGFTPKFKDIQIMNEVTIIKIN